MKHWVLALSIFGIFGCTDMDGDGTPASRDCDDNNASVFPGQREVCDGIDNDCDGYVDEGVSLFAYWDRDGDGFGDDSFVRRVCEQPVDGVTQGGDCDDLEPNTHPEAEEVCDGRDNNCDGKTDEGVQRPFFADEDGDGFGVPDTEVWACEPGFGASDSDQDCDDTDSERSPGLSEWCDEKDNDCDESIDEDLHPIRQWEDADGDGFGDPNQPVLACGPITGVSDSPTDCDDSDPAIGPHADEIRGNTIDEDCDGYLNELAVPDEFATLDDALDSATAGQVVQLGAGTWIGAYDLRGLAITLAGEGCDTTTLYGDGTQTVLEMDSGELRGLTVSGGLSDQGGGVYVSGSMTMQGVCISQNAATEYGGGIFIDTGLVQLVETRIDRNIAYTGAGLFVDEDAQVLMERSHILENASTRHGAGLYVRDGWVQAQNIIFAANQANYNGGAFYIENRGQERDEDGNLVDDHAGTPYLTITQSTLHGNWAKQHGQVGYNSRGELAISSSILSDHMAEGSISLSTLFYSSSAVRESFTDLVLWNNAVPDQNHQYFPTANRSDPGYQSWSLTSDPAHWDLRLGPNSDLIGTLDTVANPDDSIGDPGAYGGPFAPDNFNQTYADDVDEDGMPTGFEWRHGLNPWVDDSELEPDGDGLTHLEEYHLQTDPSLADSDSDGVDDGVEQDNGDNPVDSRDQRPICLIHGPKWVLPGSVVSVGSEQSADPNGLPLTRHWTLDSPTGSAVSSPDHPTPELAEWTVDTVGEWGITLELDNGRTTVVCDWTIESLDAWVVPDDFTSIQAALDSASDDDIVAIRPGTYSEALNPGGVSVTLVGLGEPNETVIDAHQVDSVLRLENEETLTLRSLTLQGGEAQTGGGVHIAPGAGLSTEDVVIQHNDAYDCGGGLYSNGKQLTLRDTVLRANFAEICGGGLALYNTPVHAERLSIWQNQTFGEGGGLHIEGGSIQTFYNAWFQDNEASISAAVHRNVAGSYDATFFNSVFIHNKADDAVIGVERGHLAIISSLMAFNDAPSQHNTTGAGTFSPLHGLSATTGSIHADSGNLTGHPSFAFFSNDGDPRNDHLGPRPDALEIDNGYPWHYDTDSSRADIGFWGGPYAPRTASLFTIDSDEDGLSNGWEHASGLDAHTSNIGLDSDGDGLTDEQEWVMSTHPLRSDTDSDGVSDGDEVSLGSNPNDPFDNQPTARAGVDQRAHTDDTVNLDGRGSTDPNGDPLTYQWVLVSAPTGSVRITADIQNATHAQAQFNPDMRGIYRFTLTVSDGAATSKPDLLTLEVYGDLHIPSAYSTISDAVSVMRADDTLVFEAGTIVGHIESPGIDFNIRGEGVNLSEWIATHGYPALTLNSGETVHISNLAIRDGTGHYGGAIDCNRSTSSTEFIEVHIENSLFENNVSSYGGAISLQRCLATIENVDFRDNAAGMSGGAIYSMNSEVEFQRGIFESNLSYSTGGAIYARHSDLGLSNLIAIDNTAFGSGGAIYQSGGDLSLAFSTLVANTGFSGAIVSQSSLSLDVNHSIIRDSDRYGIYANTTGSLASTYNLFFDNDSGATYPSALSSGTTHLVEDPRFVAYDLLELSGWDVRLRHDSPARDGGDTSFLDLDGTTVDIGAFGGLHTWSDYNRYYMDSDGDGLADGWESENGLNPAVDDSALDPDGDGLDNSEEYDLGTHPRRLDSDLDGVDDDEETDDGDDPADPTDNRPDANAGADRTVMKGTKVTLSGTGSTDPNGDALTYTWRFQSIPGRSTLTDSDLNNAGTSAPDFTPDTAGAFIVALFVSDGQADSEIDTMRVQVPGDLVIPDDYSTLPEAVSAISSGYTINIEAGSYAADVDLAGKDIILQGDDRDTTVLYGVSSRSMIRAARAESLTLNDLTLRAGHSAHGGAIYASSGDIQLNHVTFEDHLAGKGGAIYIRFGTVTATDVQFTDNVVHYQGGAMYLYESTFDGVQVFFVGNTSQTYYGGAIYSVNSEINVTNGIFSGNSAYAGGVFYITGGSTSPTTLELNHVSATLNEAKYGGFLRSIHGDILVKNSLITDTIDGNAFSASSATGTSYTQSYSLVFNNSDDHFNENITDPTGTNGNIESDPNWTSLSNDEDWTNEDWVLLSTSPAIDAGTGDKDTDHTAADMGAFGGPLGDWSPY